MAETHGKCAYCEAPTSLVAHGDVEHYRPKSEYWWLAYVYDNYLASCQLCNQSFKKAKFPLVPGARKMTGPRIAKSTSKKTMRKLAAKAIPDPLDKAAVRKFERAHRKEEPLIPNPYVDDPQGLLGWKVREGIGEVELVAHPGRPEATPLIEACIECLGLNRPLLRRARFDAYENYSLARAVLDVPALPDPLVKKARAAVDSFKSAESAFAGMIRYFEGQT
jgi:hypothetical protein